MCLINLYMNSVHCTLFTDHTWFIYIYWPHICDLYTHLNKVEEMNLYNICFNDVESVGFHLTTSNSTIVSTS